MRSILLAPPLAALALLTTAAPLLAPLLAALSLLAAAVPPAAAAEVKLKLATLAPDGSPWHRALQGMGQAWSDSTDGRVRLVIYPGGVAGDDPDMVRKMRIGQLHGAALTVTGLAGIDPSFNLFSTPLFFESFEEFVHVRDALTPELSRRLAERGFVLVQWGFGGWLHFFAKQPVRTLDEARAIKIFTWAGDSTMLEIYKANGFHAVPLAATDILTGLQTGMIDGIPTTPLAALTLQWFRQAPYMLDVAIAPLTGATVLTQRAWGQISEADRQALRAAALETQHQLDAEIPARDARAVDEMVERGLTVVAPARGAQAESWSEAAHAFAKLMESAPPEVRDAAARYREEFRARARAAAAGDAPGGKPAPAEEESPAP